MPIAAALHLPLHRLPRRATNAQRNLSQRRIWPLLACLAGLSLTGCGGKFGSWFERSEPLAVAADGTVLEVPLAQAVAEVSHNLHLRKLAYDSDPAKRRDCSGIFHEAMLQLQQRCPDLLAPGFHEARSSANILDWYREQGALKDVSQPLASTHLLRPGAVLFYKDSDEDRASHMGIVVNLQRSADGDLISYRLFHGRRPGRPAAITKHLAKPRSDEPLGVGDKAWFAASHLCPGASCRCSPASSSALRNSGGLRVASTDPQVDARELLLSATTSSGASTTAKATAEASGKGGNRGIASYYHPKLNGKTTASGERYDHSELTAAHRSLPFGTRLRVTRVDNGRSVEVRVNDRGPYAPKRIIDLSGAAAEKLDMLSEGLVEVRIEHIE